METRLTPEQYQVLRKKGTERRIYGRITGRQKKKEFINAPLAETICSHRIRNLIREPVGQVFTNL